MKFPAALLRGTLVKRYKRFLADIILESGEEITAHCANPGAMLTLKTPGSRVWVSAVPETVKRKLRYDWQLVECGANNLVGINTMAPNKLVEEALTLQLMPEFKAYTQFRREVKYGKNSRIDFLLGSETEAPLYLEVKNVNHIDGQTALFPDAVTARGAKHLQELMDIKAQGMRAAVLYVVQRADCTAFDLAHGIDPVYAAAARLAQTKGVEFYCYACKVGWDEIKIDQALRIIR
jgi:sugar fermentation stimulation protein